MGTTPKKRNSLTSRLQNWAKDFKITLVALTALLLILRLFNHNKLSMDARTLMGTPRVIETVEMIGGEYLHFGLKRAIMAMLRENKKRRKSVTYLKLMVNVDGLPILHTLISQIDSKEVYPIGVFFGQSKPKDANEFLQTFFD